MMQICTVKGILQKMCAMQLSDRSINVYHIPRKPVKTLPSATEIINADLIHILNILSQHFTKLILISSL